MLSVSRTKDISRAYVINQWRYDQYNVKLSSRGARMQCYYYSERKLKQDAKLIRNRSTSSTRTLGYGSELQFSCTRVDSLV